LAVTWDTNVAHLRTEEAGTGTSRGIQIDFETFKLYAKKYSRSVMQISDAGAITWPQGVGEIGTCSLSVSRDIRYTTNSITFAVASGNGDVRLKDVATNVLQLDNREGGTATFKIVNTYTDESNHERAFFTWDTNIFEIGTEKAGTGSARAMALQTDGTDAINIDTSQNVTIAGNLLIGTIKSGATQAAAGAAANELWKTASHATLPDNVVMIGV